MTNTPKNINGFTLTVRQTATQLGKSERTITNWIHTGKLPAQKLGRSWRISNAAVVALGASQAPAPEATPTSLPAEAISQIANAVAEQLKPLFAKAEAMPEAKPETKAIDEKLALVETELKPLAEKMDALQKEAVPMHNNLIDHQNQIVALTKENSILQHKVTAMETQITQLQQQLHELATAMQRSQTPTAKEPSETREPERSEPANRKQGAKQPGEKRNEPTPEKAENWCRQNPEKWYTEECRLNKASGRTWQELAENIGDKIVINGRPSAPRAYLHVIEKWDTGKVWDKMKAKVALEWGSQAQAS